MTATTPVYVGLYERPYSLFGLTGNSSRQIVRWWVGDLTHMPPAPQDDSLPTRAMTALFILVICLAALSLAVPPEVFPLPLRGLYRTLSGFAMTGYGLTLLAIVVWGAWGAVRTRLFPTQADRDLAAKWEREGQFALHSRTLTVVLWLGKGRRPGRDAPPALTLTRRRSSPPISADSLLKDRYIYVTLEYLTDDEYTELYNKLTYMDI